MVSNQAIRRVGLNRDMIFCECGFRRQSFSARLIYLGLPRHNAARDWKPSGTSSSAGDNSCYKSLYHHRPPGTIHLHTIEIVIHRKPSSTSKSVRKNACYKPWLRHRPPWVLDGEAEPRTIGLHSTPSNTSCTGSDSVAGGTRARGLTRTDLGVSSRAYETGWKIRKSWPLRV